MFGSLKRDDNNKMNVDANTTNHVMAEENIEDLEDFRNKGKTSSAGPRPIIRCYEVNSKQHPDNSNCLADLPQQPANHSASEMMPLQHTEISTNSIDRNMDYQGWLEMKKRKWKDAREKRKRQRYPIF